MSKTSDGELIVPSDTPHPILELMVSGRRIPINGRVAEMIRWLAVNADALNQQDKGWVQFDFNGKRLTPRDSRTHKEIIVKE